MRKAMGIFYFLFFLFFLLLKSPKETDILAYRERVQIGLKSSLEEDT